MANTPNFNFDKKTGTIYLIYWYDSQKRLQISTRIRLSGPAEWDKASQLPVDKNLKTKNGEKVVDVLAKYKSAMNESLKVYDVNGGDLKKLFNSKFSGTIVRGGLVNAEKLKFLEFYERKLLEFHTDKKTNYKSYKTTYNNLIQYFGKRRPSFEELDENFFDGFKKFMEKTKDYKKNMIAGQINNLKAIIGKAYTLKLHANLSFREVKISREVAVNVFLSLKELDKIYQMDLHRHPAIERTRDSFIVGAFTGLRFEDWGRVRKDLIKGGILRIQARKTNDPAQIPVHKYVIEILDKYNGAMPPQISNQKTNENIKRFCKIFRQKIEKPYTKGGRRKLVPDVFEKWQMCSTHTARRSLCTNLIIQGANPYWVMKISGHKTYDAFQKYIKLDELLAADNLKNLPMFKNGAGKSPDVNLIDEDSKAISTKEESPNPVKTSITEDFPGKL